MNNLTNKNKNFVIGAFIIAVSHILVKVIGALYKIPLDTYILKTEGMGIYNSSYTIYNWLFVISTAGLPVAISKMVAESTAKGNYDEARKIFRISKGLLLCVGAAAAGAMFFFAHQFSSLISAPSAFLTMQCMAPSLFFVSLSSSYRGFYQGQQNMLPTALSEVIEAFSKLALGLSLAYFAMKIYGEYFVASAGAITGVTIGTALSCLYLIGYNAVNIRKFPKGNLEKRLPRGKTVLLKLIKIAIPVTIGVSVFTLTSVIDTAMVMNQLKGLGYLENERLSMFGYLNRAIALFNLPPTIIAAIAISIVPTIAAALALKNNQTAIKNAKSALRITILFAVPCAAGLSALAKPILELLYHDGNYSFLLNIMGIAVVFVTLVQVCNAILQAWGHVWLPVKNMLIGGVVKVLVNLVLVSRPEWNINGAPIGTLLCYFTVMSLNIYDLKRITGMKFELMSFVVKPVISALATAAGAILCYHFVSGIIAGNVILVAVSIVAGGLCYFVSLFAIRGIDYDDVLLLPKGEKIANILKKFHLI